MEYIILLSYNEDTKKIEEEEQTKFVRSTLEAVGIPLDFWNPDEPFSIETKIKLRDVLDKYDISIIDNHDGGLDIYHEKTIIGGWKIPQYKMKKDLSQVNPKKKVYMEMTISFFSIFE